MCSVEMPPERLEALGHLAQRLNITLSSYALLDEALTHASSIAEFPEKAGRDYEALEFLGMPCLNLRCRIICSKECRDSARVTILNYEPPW